MTKEELISKLPSDLRPWAKLWLPVILQWSEDKLAEFIASAAGMPWYAAYEKIVDSMRIEEKIAELQMARRRIEQLNFDNAKFIAEQRTLFFGLLAKAILSLK